MKLRSSIHVAAGVALVAAVALVYVAGMQTGINGQSSPDMIDVGELQVALSTWGTTHPTGYPLYTITGNLLVALGRAFGIAPALASSALSVAAALGALGLVYALVRQATGRTLAATTSLLLLAATPAFWLNGVITEVYALNMLLVMGMLYASWLVSQGQRVSLIALALLIGLALAHHRTAVLMLPPVLVLLWPKARPKLSPLRAALLLLLVLAPFALYAYVPLRMYQQAPWIYEQQRWGLAALPAFAWDGFAAYFLGREYSWFLQPPASVDALAGALRQLVGAWTAEMGVLGVVAGFAGLIVALAGSHKRLALSLWLVVIGFGAFSLLYRVDDVASMLLPSAAALAIGAGFLVHWAWSRLGRLAGAGLAIILIAGILFRLPAEWKTITAITRNPDGQAVIDAARRVPVACPTILSHWGVDWFAFNYAALSTKELGCARIEPPHADIRADWQRGERVFASSHFLNQMPLAQLEAAVGRVYLSSAGQGMIELSGQPLTSADQEITGPAVDMGGVITLLGHELTEDPASGALHLALYWRAAGAQRADYSVFVHASDRDAIAVPDDIVAQSDSLHPVYGWYPTSRWQAGEIVRDDYVLPENATRPARLVEVGLYQQAANGSFTNLGSAQIRVADAKKAVGSGG